MFIIEKLNIVKMAVLPKLIKMLKVIPVKMLVGFFKDEKLILKCVCKDKVSRIAKNKINKFIKRKKKNPIQDKDKYHMISLICGM